MICIYCRVDISPEAQNTQGTTCKTHETQEEGRPKCILWSFLEGATKYPGKELQRQSSEQRLKERASMDLHLNIHRIYSHQNQTLLWMLTSASWQEPDITVSWGVLTVPGKYRSGCTQLSIRWSTGSPMKELEKVPKKLKGFAAPKEEQDNQYPQSSQGLKYQPKSTHGGTHGSSCLCSRWLPYLNQWDGRPLVLWRFYGPV